MKLWKFDVVYLFFERTIAYMYSYVKFSLEKMFNFLKTFYVQYIHSYVYISEILYLQCSIKGIITNKF